MTLVAKMSFTMVPLFVNVEGQRHIIRRHVVRCQHYC